jgi:putative ATPase
MSDDLFAAAADELRHARAPLAARLRPRTIDDVVGQDQLVGEGRPLRRLVETDRLS